MEDRLRTDTPQDAAGGEDFPARIADMLEQTATRVRTLTTDRVAGYVLWAALGLILGFLGLLILVFVLVALFRLVDTGIGDLLGSDTWGNVIAYFVFGGLFVIGGALLWRRRHQETEPEEA